MFKNPLVKSFLFLVLLPWSVFGICALIGMLGFSLDSKGNILSTIAMGGASIAFLWGLGGAWQFLKILKNAYRAGLLKFPALNIKRPSFSYKLLIFPVGVIFLFMFLNPSYSRFKEYASEVTTSTHKMVYTRTHNYLILSIYEKRVATVYDGEYEYSTPEKYIGFCMNFYKISK